MRASAHVLRLAVHELERDLETLGYDVRTQIERGIFLTARELASTYVGHDLVGFSAHARHELNLAIDIAGPPMEVVRIVELAFELRSVLCVLGSGNPYLQLDLIASHTAGRRDFVALFVRRLKRYLRSVEALVDTMDG